MALGYFPRVFNRPVPVYWAGFESDTYRLEREGWSFDAEQDVRRQTIRLAMHHSGCQMTGITEIADWHYEEARHHGWMPKKPLRMVAVGNVHVWKDDIMGGHYGGREHKVMYLNTFKPVSCTPHLLRPNDMQEAEKSEPLAELLHFLPVDPKRIILPSDAVPALMDRILELQEPDRQKHFQDQVRGKAPTLSAQIF